MRSIGPSLGLLLYLSAAGCTAQQTVAAPGPPTGGVDAYGYRHVFHPKPLSGWELRSSAGISVTILPRPVAEEEIRQAPMLDFHARLGCPADFSVLFNASTNIITNKASFGAAWGFNIGAFSFSAGDMHSYWYGSASLEGFDTDAQGWINLPFVAAGYSDDEFLVHVRGEGQIILSRSTRVGEQELSSSRNLASGMSMAIVIEQPFFRRTSVALGIRLTWSNAAPHSWLAFSTIRERQLYPEFFFGVIL